MKMFIVCVCFEGVLLSHNGQQKLVLTDLEKQGLLHITNRTTSVVKETGSSLNRLFQDTGEAILWQAVRNFQRGTITAEMRGQNVSLQSFTDFAFHGQNDSKYKAMELLAV